MSSNLVVRIGADIKNFTKAMSKTKSKTRSMGDSLIQTGAMLTKKVTLPLLGIATASTKVGSEFQKNMNNVAVTTGATGEEFAKLERAALEMGRNSVFGARKVTDAMFYMGLAGWETGQIIEGLPAVLNLAESASMDLGSATDILTNTVTAFGLSASDASHVADVLAVTNKNANATVEQLGQSFKYVGPIAGSLGYSVDDVAVALGLMANAGIQGSQAGTALRSALLSLSDPTEETKKQMDKLGISMFDSEGNAKPLNDILIDLRASLADADDQTRTLALTNLFGATAVTGMTAVVTASEKEFKKLAGSIAGAEGQSEYLAKSMRNNLIAQTRLLGSQMEHLGIRIFQVLEPALAGLVRGVTNVFTWFGNLNDSTLRFIVTTGALVGAIGPVMTILGKVTNALTNKETVLGRASLKLGAYINKKASATIANSAYMTSQIASTKANIASTKAKIATNKAMMATEKVTLTLIARNTAWTAKMWLATIALKAKTVAFLAFKLLTNPVAAGIALIGVAAAGLIGWFNKSCEATEEFKESLEDLTSENEKMRQGISESARAFEQQRKITDAGNTTMRNAIATISDLTNKEKLNEVQKRGLANANEFLNEQLGTSIELFDKEGNLLEDNYKAMNARVEVMAHQSTLNTYQDRFVELLAEEEALQWENYKIQNKMNGAREKLESGTIRQREYNQIMEELAEEYDTNNELLAENTRLQEHKNDVIDDSKDKIIALNEEIGLHGAVLSDFNEQQLEVIEELINTYNRYRDNVVNNFEKVEVASGRYVTVTDENGKKVQKSYEEVGKTVTEVMASINDTLEHNIEVYNNFANNLTTITGYMGQDVTDEVYKMSNGCKFFIDQFAQAAKLSAVDLSGDFTGTMSEMGIDCRDTFKTMVNDAQTEMSRFETNMENTADVAMKMTNARVGEGAEELVDQMPRLADSASTTLMDSILSAGFAESGFTIGKSMAEGVGDSAQQVEHACRDMAQGSIDTTNHIFQSNSPSRVYSKIGEGITRGLVNGIRRTRPQLTTELNRMGPDFTRAGENAMNGLQRGLNNRRGSVMNTARSIAGEVTRTMQNALRINSPSKVMAEDVGAPLMQGLSLGIESNADVVMSELEALANKFKHAFDNNYSLKVGVNSNELAVPQSAKNNTFSTPNNQPTYIVLDGKVVGELMADDVKAGQNKRARQTNQFRGGLVMT